MTSMTSTKKPKKPKGKPIKEKELKEDGGIKELETLSNLAVNIRKLAKFKHETSPRQQQELFKIYGQLIDKIIERYQSTKEKKEEKKNT